jgi:hypothetical protein
MPKRIIATFAPQAWVNDYAVSIDPEGPTRWDVTDFVTANNSREVILEMEWSTSRFTELDRLQEDPAAPEWIREWSGPFDLSISGAADYYEQEN